MQLFIGLPRGGVQAVEASLEQTVACVVSAATDAPSTSYGCDVRVVCRGRTLDPRATLAAAGVGTGSTLELLPRLRGGGGDGGSTGAESRSCYLEMYAGKRRDKVNPEEERLARWTTCQLTGMPLQPPCVADELGNLFNKDAVLQALVSKSMPASLAHISSLKHVFDIQLHANPTAAKAAKGNSSSRAGDGGAVGAAVRFSCPITGQPMGGKGRCVAFLGRGGHVVSERALKEVPAVVEELVGGKWTPEDLLFLNPPAEEQQDLRLALAAKRDAARAAKKEKKKGKAAVAAGAATASGSGAGATAAMAPVAGGKRPAENGSTAAAAEALYGGEAARNGAKAAAKKFKASELKPAGADEKVWSSIFTSSRGEGPRNDYLVRGSSRMATAS